MLKRMTYFEKFFMPALSIYLENWPLTVSDSKYGLLLAIITIAIDKNVSNQLQIYSLAFIKVFICSRV